MTPSRMTDFDTRAGMRPGRVTRREEAADALIVQMNSQPGPAREIIRHEARIGLIPTTLREMRD